MTVPSEVNRSGPYLGNGVTTVFDYGFRILNQAHLRVVQALSDGTETDLVLSSDYTVYGVGEDGGGSITLTSPLASGRSLTIIRKMPFTQNIDLENQGAYFAETVEEGLDFAVMRDQQIKEELDRAIKVPVSEDGASGELAAELAANITRLAQSADEIDTVASINGDVTTVAGIAGDVALLADVSGVLSGTASAVRQDEKMFTGDGTTTVWTLDRAPGVAENVLVWIGGAIQDTADYSIAGNALTISPPVGLGVEIRTLVMTLVTATDLEQMLDDATQLATPGDATVSRPKLTSQLSSVVPRSILEFGAVGDGVTNDTTAVTAALASGFVIDGAGRTYLVNSKPDSFRNIRNAEFKVGYVRYPTKDFLRWSIAKITNTLQYNAWPQDSCYKVDDQLRVWTNEKQSHADGTGRVVLQICDDNGTSWPISEYLDERAGGVTVWSATFLKSSRTECVIPRVPAGLTDIDPYTYQLRYRTIGTAGTQDYNGPFTIKNITFPVPTGFSGQPIMVHSACEGHDGSLVLGASYAEGAAIMRTPDLGDTWTYLILGASTTFEEPTVRYIPSLDLYTGFIRNGGTGQPRQWRSTDRLATVGYYTAPSDYFNGGNMSDACVPFDVDDEDVIHAFVGYRNGVVEGHGTDERASCFYLSGPAVTTDWWKAPTTKVRHIGMFPRREPGGASALSQGSVICDGKRVHFFQGFEQRTGTFGGYGVGNRVSDIMQITIHREDYGGLYDTRTDLMDDRSNKSPFRKIAGLDAFTIPTIDTGGRSPPIFSGRVNHQRYNSAILISGGVLTLPGRFGYYFVDTEAAASLDDVDSIVTPDMRDGDEFTLLIATGSRAVNYKAAALGAGSDILMNHASDILTLIVTNSTAIRVKSFSKGQIRWIVGAGSPEGVITAPIGSLYTRTNGGAGTTFYVKESGTGNTGWTAK